MQTSEKYRSLQLVGEAGVAGALAASIASVIPGANPWLPGIEPHPAWIAIAVMAAFYGVRGLLITLPMAWASVGLAGVLLGAPAALGARATSAGDALALAGCLAVAAIGSLHRRRREELDAQLRAAERFAEEDAVALEELEQVALTFRARSQRIDRAITFWRDVAERLERGNPTEAAQAALELCMVRTGARAGIVRRCEGDALHNLAWRGRWTESNPLPRDIFGDRCMNAAIQRGCVVLAEDIDGAGPEEADVAAPVTARDGRIIGVLALRGLSRHQLRDADISDIGQTAQWLAGAMAPETRHPATTAQDDDATAMTPAPTPLRPGTPERAATWE